MTKNEIMNEVQRFNERLTDCMEGALEKLEDHEIETFDEYDAKEFICLMYQEYFRGYDEGGKAHLLRTKLEERRELKKRFTVIKND